MSFNDSLIQRFEDTVDDEYQRIIVHQSSTVSLNAMMWANFVAAAVLVWVFPSPQTRLITMVMFLTPLVGALVGQRWLRKRIPTPRANKLTRWEVIGLAVVIVAWISGTAMAEGADLPETAGYFSGALMGALCGIAIAAFLFKVLVPKIRQRDQKRLDKQYGDDEQ